MEDIRWAVFLLRANAKIVWLPYLCSLLHNQETARLFTLAAVGLAPNTAKAIKPSYQNPHQVSETERFKVWLMHYLPATGHSVIIQLRGSHSSTHIVFPKSSMIAVICQFLGQHTTQRLPPPEAFLTPAMHCLQRTEPIFG